MTVSEIKDKIFQISSDEEFNILALEIFRFQYQNNSFYKQYVDCVQKDVSQINHYSQIPFLPIEFFKSQKIICTKEPVKVVFGSSGTSGMEKSLHHVTDISVYEKAAIACFEMFYGDISNFTFLALLPSYLERQDSSLVWMINHYIQKSKYASDCGFFLNEYDQLSEKLKFLNHEKSRKILLIGVSFALLDFAEQFPLSLNNTIVMETGGMKGKRNEITRSQLHEILCKQFNISNIHSEYGMTELLSQAYSSGKGIFKLPPWMKILIRELNDPLCIEQSGRSGGINIIDLANINSCSFIATQDVGKVFNDNSFEVTGRFDYSDTRGCNLMVL